MITINRNRDNRPEVLKKGAKERSSGSYQDKGKGK